MQFSLIVEHPACVRTKPTHMHSDTEPEHYVMIDAGCLSDAARLATPVDGRLPLLRIRLTDAHPAPEATEFFLPPRCTAIASLIHDARLLGIADGALVTGDDTGYHGSRWELIARDLHELGYRVHTAAAPAARSLGALMEATR